MTRAKKRNKLSEKERSEFRGQMLEWYDQYRRSLPWRAEAGKIMEPYKVWLSEIMLQQTTVGAVIPYYTKFLDKWPNIQALAEAAQEDVLNEWAGLGYYARARNLHKCAKVVAHDLGGVFPEEQNALRALPGIGDYTSAAIRAIAFNKPASVMDGNIERIMARYFLVEDPLPKSKSLLKSLTDDVFDHYADRPGDLAQAMMDLGSSVCIAKTPRCSICPLQGSCLALKHNMAADLPRKMKKKKKPHKQGRVFWLVSADGDVLLHRRPQSGLLAGMVGLPTSAWTDTLTDLSLDDFFKTLSFDVLKMQVHHTFTHFDLTLSLETSKVTNDIAVPEDYFWEAPDRIGHHGFPTVFKKAVRIFQKS